MSVKSKRGLYWVFGAQAEVREAQDRTFGVCLKGWLAFSCMYHSSNPNNSNSKKFNINHKNSIRNNCNNKRNSIFILIWIVVVIMYVTSRERQNHPGKLRSHSSVRPLGL